METKEVKASLVDAFNKIEDVKKSLADSEVVKNEAANEDTKDGAKKSVEADKAEKSDEVADKEEKSAKAPKEVAKPKEIDKIEDKEGHEQASKSADIDLMAKSLDAMVEMHKAYQAMAESTIKSLQAENASLRKSIADADVKKSVKKDVDDPDADDVDGKSTKSAKAEKCDAEKCDTDNTDKDDQQASKSVDEAEKAKKPADTDEDDEAEKSVAKSDDEVAKSMPEGKAVSTEAPEADEANDAAKKSLKMGDFKGVLVKSISAFANTQDSENLHRASLLKSLYADVRDVADDEAVSDKLINRYNNI